MDYLLKKQLHILVQLALSDEVFTDSEKDAIIKVGKQQGAKEAEIQEIINHPNMKESLVPMTVTAKMNFMIDSIMVMLADEKISPSEERFVHQIAKKLGFREEVVAFLVEEQTEDRQVLREKLLPYLVQA